MIRNTASVILELLKKGEGLSKKEVFENPNYDMQKIITLILNECRCSAVDRNGNSPETSIDIAKVRNIIMTFFSDSKELQEELVLAVLTKDEVIGPFIKLKFVKTYDPSFEKFDLNIEKPFEEDFGYIFGKDNDEVKEKLIEQIIKPYVRSLIYNDRVLSKRDKIGVFINKNFKKDKSKEELIEEYKELIKSISNMNEEKVTNTANYILKNILENRYFKNEIVRIAIKNTDLQVLGRQYVSFSALVNSMSNEVYQKLVLKESPAKQINEIKQIYADMITQLIILSTDFNQLTKSKIESQIKQINKGISSNLYDNIKKYVNPETGYRNIDTSIEKNNKEIKFVKHEEIDDAMKKLVLCIKNLLKESENMETRQYIKEVTRINYRLVRINPFIDGNIRTSKAVSNILLQEKNLISYFGKDETDEYLNTINKAHLLIAENSKIEKEYMENLVNNPNKCNEIEDEYLSMWM